MNEDLNVDSLLETRAERAPTTELDAAALPGRARRDRGSSPITAITIAAVALALGVLIISGTRGRRRVPVIERY